MSNVTPFPEPEDRVVPVEDQSSVLDNFQEALQGSVVDIIDVRGGGAEFVIKFVDTFPVPDKDYPGETANAISFAWHPAGGLTVSFMTASPPPGVGVARAEARAFVGQELDHTRQELLAVAKLLAQPHREALADELGALALLVRRGDL